MKSSALMMFGLATTMVAAVAGCSGGVGMGLAPLDHPAMVVANTAQPQSQVTLYHQGALDPSAALTVLKVENGFVRLRSDHEQAAVEQLIFLLADADLAPSTSMPQGLKLRHQRLSLEAPLGADVSDKTMNSLTAHAHGSLTYRADLLDEDGTLRSVGPVQTDDADFDVRATRYEFGVHVTVDAAPQGTCLKLPGLLDISNCSLYVTMDGDSISN
jgi:hypothetical protein